MIQRNVITAASLARATSAVAIGLGATLLGCSDESINMGEDVPVLVDSSGLPLSSRCLESSVLEGEIVVRNQEEVDALEGCEVIDGNLSVAAFAGAHLRALHALTAVRGALAIGGTEYDYTQELDPAARQRLVEDGWLSSLEGLEALESAGSLSLTGFTSEDLGALGQLRALTDGSLSLQFATNLKNFDGLQKLVGLRSLFINAALQLESFDGLTLPEYMTSLDLTDVDLRQLTPIGVRYLDGLYVEDTQLHDFSAFANLVVANSLMLVANRQLESLAGLENLERVRNLDLDYNRYLLEVPDFEKLYGLEVLRITGSPLLARLPAFQTMQLPPPLASHIDQENFILLRPDVIQLVDLGLTTFSMPAGWSSAAVVKIEYNANLSHVDFTAQSYIDYLSIRSNPLLENVSTGALDKINVLDVVDNPKLSVSAFDTVRRLDMTASGNADAP